MALRLVQFEQGGKRRVGVQLENAGKVVDITAVNPAIPTDMKSFIENWDANILLAQSAVQQVLSEGQTHVYPPGGVTLKAPIHNPQKVICIGMNYVDHCTEQGIPVPKEPVLFSKFPSAITDPDGVVVYPKETECLDYEVELAFVISKRGKYIKEEDVMGYIAGYTVAHDVSARDWQMQKNGGQWLIGKTFDTFCPIGPAIVTVPAISNPHNLGIRCRLNGEIVQNSNTNQLVHKTEALVSHISRFVTLEPGDIVLTGTPPGVGCFRKPPVWLKRGDVVECEVDEIGTITNIIQ